MKISSQTKNGLEIMIYLAQNFNKGLQSVSDISSCTEIGEKFIEKLLGKLRKANLIVALRGATGGYKLINSPTAISLLKIFQALDDNFMQTTINSNNETKNCAYEFVFKNIDEKINKFLDETTLQDVINFKGE